MAGGTIVHELNDIQSCVLRARPAPYRGTYILLRTDDRQAGDRVAIDSRDRFRRQPDEPRERCLGQCRVDFPEPPGAGRAAGFS